MPFLRLDASVRLASGAFFLFFIVEVCGFSQPLLSHSPRHSLRRGKLGGLLGLHSSAGRIESDRRDTLDERDANTHVEASNGRRASVITILAAASCFQSVAAASASGLSERLKKRSSDSLKKPFLPSLVVQVMLDLLRTSVFLNYCYKGDLNPFCASELL